MDMKNIFLAIILAAIFILPAGVHATWYNTSYTDKIQITVNNSAGGSLTNFPMVLNQSSNLSVGFNTAALIATGRMRADCYDILIVNSTENGAYPHYVENNTCNTTNSIITGFVNLATGNNTLWIYFNAPNATNHQNRSAGRTLLNATTWYDFSEGTGTTSYEYTGYQNPANLTLTNNGTAPTASFNSTARGYGLGLEGATDKAIAQNQLLYLQGNIYSIELWIWNDQQTATDSPEIFSDQVSRCHTFWGTGGTSYKWQWYSAGDWKTSDAVTIPLNVWTHLVIVKNNANMTFYVNGVSKNSTVPAAWAEDTLSGCRALSFGMFQNPTGRNWNGTVDNFRMYVNYTITPEEAKAKYDGLAFAYAPLQELDATPPVVAIQSPTNTTYATTNITFSYTASDLYLDSCTRELNGVNTTTGCLNQTFTAVQGNNNVKLYANDTTNNVGVASVNFFVDSIAPTVSIQLPANTTYNVLNRTLNFSASDANVLVCTRELNGVNTSIASCLNQTFLAAELNNNLKVYVNDPANNSAVASVNFFADDIAPSYSAISVYPPSPVIRNTTAPLNATYNITVTDNGAVDTVLFKRPAANLTIIAIYVGNDTYSVTDLVSCGETQYGWDINDTAGNVNNTPYFNHSISCGVTIPEIFLIQPYGIYNYTSVPLVFTAYNNESINQCWSTIDDVNFINVTGLCYNQTLANVSTTIVATEGSHFLTLYVTDMFDIVNYTSTYFSVDTHPPNITVNSPTGNVPSNTPVSVSLTLSDPSGVNMSTCFYSLDGGALTPCGGTISVDDGSHTITFYVYDYAGNQLTFTENFTAGLVIVGATAVVLILIPLLLAIMLLWILSQKIQNGGDVKEMLFLFILLIMCIAMIGIIWSVINGVV